MSEQPHLFDPGPEQPAGKDPAYSEYRQQLGRNNAVRNWRVRNNDFDQGRRPEPPLGFGGLDNPHPHIRPSVVPAHPIPMASEEAQDDYWSENVHPGAEAARNHAAMANLDVEMPSLTPPAWPRTYNKEHVPTNSISTVQFEGVQQQRAEQMIGKTTPPVQIEKRLGENVLVDGNHRVGAALTEGRLFVDAEVGTPVMGPLRRVVNQWDRGWRYERPGESLGEDEAYSV